MKVDLARALVGHHNTRRKPGLRLKVMAEPEFFECAARFRKVVQRDGQIKVAVLARLAANSASTPHPPSTHTTISAASSRASTSTTSSPLIAATVWDQQNRQQQ